MSHQNPMKFIPTDDEMANEAEPAFAVLALKFARGKSYQEIADTEGIPLGTVKSRINRARARILCRREFEANKAKEANAA